MICAPLHPRCDTTGQGHAHALLAVAPICDWCQRRVATRLTPPPPHREGDVIRCDRCSYPEWADLPQAAAVRALTCQGPARMPCRGRPWVAS